jgi:hypothetical protein
MLREGAMKLILYVLLNSPSTYCLRGQPEGEGQKGLRIKKKGRA